MRVNRDYLFIIGTRVRILERKIRTRILYQLVSFAKFCTLAQALFDLRFFSFRLLHCYSYDIMCLQNDLICLTKRGQCGNLGKHSHDQIVAIEFKSV